MIRSAFGVLHMMSTGSLDYYLLLLCSVHSSAGMYALIYGPDHKDVAYYTDLLNAKLKLIVHFMLDKDGYMPLPQPLLFISTLAEY
jgi:hypothetical protein